MRRVTSSLCAAGVALLAGSAAAQTGEPAVGPGPAEASPAAAAAASPTLDPVVQAEAGTEVPRKDWKVTAAAQYRRLAVSDVDPVNDQALIYRLGALNEVGAGFNAVLRLGLLQRFVAEEGESGFRLQDTQIGVSRSAGFETQSGRDVGFDQELIVYLPTSRASQTQDLYIAPQYSAVASFELFEGLVLGINPALRYRWHQYAERAGQQGGMNTRLELIGRAGLDYAFGVGLGDLGFGGSVGTTFQKRYRAQDTYYSRASEAAPWVQGYDWEAHVTWQPLGWLTAGVALEHGGAVLRDGIVNTFFVQRDETELAFTLAASY